MSRRSLEDPVVSFGGVDKILTYVGASSIPESYTLSIILSYTLSLNNIYLYLVPHLILILSVSYAFSYRILHSRQYLVASSA